jgi:hypothetical protein
MSNRTANLLAPLLGIAALTLAFSGPLGAGETDADTGRRARFEASAGIHSFGALSDLRPAAGGDFRNGGLGLGGSAHWVMRESEGADLMLGLDFYAFGNDSNVFHVANDVQFRAMQLTPSIRFSFDRGSGPRYLLGLGVGYYEADITELSTYWWGLQTERELWRDSSAGGYISLDIDFPRHRQRKPHGFFMSLRIHSIDFGRVGDERPFGPGSGTLGPDAGDLSGPLTVLHFGYQWFD